MDRIALTDMRTAIDHNDRQFLERLHRLGEGSVQDLCEELGVTATAVRQRLVRLQGAGLVNRRTERAGRGRPHHVYSVTQGALQQLGDNYSELASILWHEMKSIEEPDVRERVVGRIRDAFIRRYGEVVTGVSLPQRMEQLRDALVAHGFDVEVDDSRELPVLRENSCPYHELAQTDSLICELEQQVFQEVLGAPVSLTECCLDGHNCCEFQTGERTLEQSPRESVA